MDVLWLCAPFKRQREASWRHEGRGWRRLEGRRLFYARLAPSGASAGSQSDKVELGTYGQKGAAAGTIKEQGRRNPTQNRPNHLALAPYLIWLSSL